jgi:hypothetical protein
MIASMLVHNFLIQPLDVTYMSNHELRKSSAKQVTSPSGLKQQVFGVLHVQTLGRIGYELISL